jgi:hypothetical protein
MSKKSDATIDNTSVLIGFAAGASTYSVLLWMRRGFIEKLRKRTIATPSSCDPLLALYGSGKKLWAEEHADEYVAKLREGWRQKHQPTRTL